MVGGASKSVACDVIRISTSGVPFTRVNDGETPAATTCCTTVMDFFIFIL